jgi:hypothetical protein
MELVEQFETVTSNSIEEEPAMVDNTPTIEGIISALITEQVAPLAARLDEGGVSVEDVVSIVRDEVEDTMTNLDISSQVESEVENQLQGFDPSDWVYVTPSDFISTNDYDPDEWVTDEAFSSFREEIETALDKVSNGDNPVDPDVLQDTINAIEERLTAIEEAIRSFGGSI